MRGSRVAKCPGRTLTGRFPPLEAALRSPLRIGKYNIDLRQRDFFALTLLAASRIHVILPHAKCG